MTLQTSTLRPGLLVSLKTSVQGNISYTKRIIERDHRVKGGAAKARWETERTITDPVEHEAARIARSKARTAVVSVCAFSAFGLLCPEADAPALEKAVAEARRIADEFNDGAKLSRVSVYVMTGRIAPDDVEAVKAINSEVRELLDDMKRGVADLDVKVIREAANRARSLGSMLAPDAAARISMAIEVARKTAREITKAGEQAAQEVDARTIRTITEARTAFLDLDGGGEIAKPAEQGRTLDLTPDAGAGGDASTKKSNPRRSARRQIEVE